MKKWACLVCICLFLAGCGTEPVWETVADALDSAQRSTPCVIQLDLPEDAVTDVFAAEGNSMYLCDGFTVVTEVLDGGNLDATLRQITGFSREELRMVESEKGKRYDCVWTAVGENGNVICRTAVLCDGGYHYAVTAEAPEEISGSLTQVWEELFSSISLGE